MSSLVSKLAMTLGEKGAILDLIKRGAYIKAYYNQVGRRWIDFHIIYNGQRYEANQTILLGIAESGKVTIVDDRKGGYVCFHSPSLKVTSRKYIS